MATSSSASEHDALLPSRTFSISYESFSSTPPEELSRPGSDESIGSVEESFTDALSCVSSTRTGTVLANKAKVWFTNGLQQSRGWFTGVNDQSKLSSESETWSQLSNAAAITMMGVAAAMVACIIDIGESRIFDWKYGVCTSMLLLDH